MGLDAVGVAVLGKELNEKIGGSRIEKVNMPDKDTVVLVLKSRNDKQTQSLLLSTLPSSSRVHFTTKRYENPLSAHSFLMHLRKHINGGVINSVDAIPHERIIKFSISSCDELGYKRNFTLISELIGRFSNVILTDEKDMITDAIKRVTLDTFSARAVVSGMPYSPPPQQEDKISPSNEQAVINLLENFTGGKLPDYLLKNLYGYSPASLRQAVFEFFGSLSPNAETVKSEKTEFYKKLTNFGDEYSPCCLLIDGQAKDFFFKPYTHMDGEFKSYSSLSDAMDAFYSEKEEHGFVTGRTATLVALLKSAIKKNERSLSLLREKIAQSMNFEEDKICGELLTANIYRLQKGASSIEVDDYYSGEKRVITLDATLSPQQNAQRFYKAYSKKRRTIEHSEQQLTIALERGDYLESILAMLEKVADSGEISEIETEMVACGLIKKPKVKRAQKPSSPLSLTVKGYKVLIGKNNIQNDKLVRSSDGGWLWLHAQKIHGSHAVIQATSVPQEVINEVASFVAHFSKASLSSNVPVDYTLVKFVKKPSGAPYGKVIYTHQQTVNVTPKKPY